MECLGEGRFESGNSRAVGVRLTGKTWKPANQVACVHSLSECSDKYSGNPPVGAYAGSLLRQPIPRQAVLLHVPLHADDGSWP